CIAVLDENAQPVAVSRPDFTTEWKRPFVASEIGEVLPHWETALYMLHPGQVAQSARLVTLTIVLLIAVALAAILAGGMFVAFDARRQLALAQKKTDFVSNVSHELKTPLTSIRMFAELLAQGRIHEAGKQAHYLRIIILESERLTRLINNVLDFARSGRKQKTYNKAEMDLLPVVDRVWEAQSLHLHEAGFLCDRVSKDAPYHVVADADAIGQVLVNLLSNAEKYSGERREVSLLSQRENGSVLISVQDRGIGVPDGEEARIFEAFHRSNDSLATNIQGSGLGLTLARNIARDHGGEVEYHKREGGGSVFTLRLPIAATEKES
ncbi:MAG: sensor histidine kinase, partial [Chthoniobacterales bacterium]